MLAAAVVTALAASLLGASNAGASEWTPRGGSTTSSSSTTTTLAATSTPSSTISTTTSTTAAATSPPSTTPTTAATPPSSSATAATPDSGVVAGQYIVTLKPGVDSDSVASESRSRGDRIDHVYRSVTHGFSGRLSDAEVRRLRTDPRVERVEADQVVYAVDTQSPAPSWGLDRIDERAPDATSSYTYPTTASDVTAYVIDTGIYAANADFSGRVTAGQNFVASQGSVNPTNTNDCNGHGTHVAGTIGGTTYGVAKGVTLVPVRVLDCNGSGTTSGVIAGIDWVTAQHTTSKAVANLSLGGGFSQSLNDAVERAVADGVVVAVAAGNSNADACTSSPASSPGALTVGATDSTDQRASFSNYGSCVDLFAPGVSITSDWMGSTTATKTISGTSMASPHVAGVAALYLSSGRSVTDLMTNVTTGRVGNAGTGSPNTLVYVGTEPCTATSCSSAAPPPTGPTNDTFANAQVLSTTTGTATGTTVAATKETGEPNHAGNAGGHSVWFRFTATGTGTATIDTFGSSFDTLLAVYTGSAVNALTQLGANDDTSPGFQSRVQLSVVAGTTYQVAVDGYAGATGNVTLTWKLPSASLPPPPPTGPTNDAFANAQVLSTTTGTATGTTVAATKETGEPNHAGNAGGHSVWFRFTATGTGTATIDTFGSSFDTLLAVYTGSAVNALTQLGANNDTSPGFQSRVQLSVVAGTTYQVAVDGYAGATGNVTLTWTLPSVSPPPPPPSGDTGWKNPTAQAANSGGDGNGFESNPTYAFADDGQYAVDTNSGNGTSTSCTSSNKDKHRFYGYGLTLPTNATVRGIEVQVQAKVNSTSSSPQMCVQLSSDGGTTWTSTKTTTTLTTSERTFTLGSTTDLWGRTWTAADLADNLRVRITNVASSTSRTFSLDVVAVRVSY